MARLKLKENATQGDAGRIIIDIADAARRAAPIDADYEVDEDSGKRFAELFVDTVAVPPGGSVDELAKGAQNDLSIVVFNVDRTADVDGNTVRVVNVNIPDITGKGTGAKSDDGADLSGVAAEAFGFVAIMGCAG